ncbi:multiple sugar transport system substrate-binding protein [Micromonospora phaseoli]|uniref:Multiple sugar transport system substrate-binding protein n=1 Tax=Micromonospora phaseoli TaxID=1144548 RepID=A0A1H6Z7K6_9ACTN|nr:sugar ABC transporter substrate-binding protein [Micromonospora phaseoli]PZW00464.1 carbohydrate ABC transporter substrate-binding protein (CUT1 family) [Micromonospora phaseoli]GIJ76943.1 sugar ABC transporter substrate-binding protein [Micromonospora phaseoli]SEJ45540.1 multiple sugar transport system substrate-binding protein [Micromonospora phaseoli]
MKIRLTAAVALTALLGLTACGGDSAESDGPVTLRMTTWSANEAHLKLFNEIAAEYTAANPDVAGITFDPIPFENYTTTLTTQIAGGNPPDLAWVLENSAPDFVSSGALVPLTDTLKNTEGYAYDELAPAATKLWQADGELYAYPFSTSPFGVFVNTDLLSAADTESPAELIAAGRWSWQNALAAASTVQAKTGKAGLVVRDFDYKGWDFLSTVWTGWGAQAWSEDGKTCGFNSPEMVEAMTALHRGIFVDKALPGPGTTADFFAGEAGMTITQISRASLLTDQKFDWDLVPLPAGPKGEYAVIGQGGMGVLKQGRNAETAADFLAYLTNPTNSAKLAQFFPPPRTSLLTAETLAKTNPLLSPEQLQQVVIDGIADGVVKPSHTGQAELNQAVRAGLDPLWQPNADVRGVLDGVCSSINPLLAK